MSRYGHWNSKKLRFAKQWMLHYGPQALPHMYWEDIVIEWKRRLSWIDQAFEDQNQSSEATFTSISDLHAVVGKQTALEWLWERIGPRDRYMAMEYGVAASWTFAPVIEPLLISGKIITLRDLTDLFSQELSRAEVARHHMQQYIYLMDFIYQGKPGYKIGVTHQWHHRPDAIKEDYAKVGVIFKSTFDELFEVGKDRVAAESLEDLAQEMARKYGERHMVDGRELFYINKTEALNSVMEAAYRLSVKIQMADPNKKDSSLWKDRPFIRKPKKMDVA